ncbi:tyrosine-type recombinase/integrase [Azonexus hydrophilus]|uniref:Tyrosine-type recombinase/integrase n=1 Tax=Azonexus hydrophilus TaxID=418702 RepID=A0ABZ2XK36_9RHOO
MSPVSPIRMTVSPGLRGRPYGPLAVSYGPQALNAARRFERFQGGVLRGDIAFPSASVRLAASLIAFDGVATSGALIAALGACRYAYQWSNAYCIEWLEHCGRVDRRHLSLWTCFALAQPNALSLAAEQVVEMLDEHLAAVAEHQNTAKHIDMLLEDAQAWLSINLAGPWFSHAIGVVRLAALPRSVLARENSKMALRTVSASPAETKNLADTAIGMSLDSYLSGDAQDGGYWLVDEIMASLPANASRPTMVKNLLGISVKHGKGAISSLILAWATDLAESGTQGDAEISPRTVSKYVRSIAHDLLDEFRGKSLESLEAEYFDGAYRRIIDSKSPGTQRNCASALASWHFFLECWLDIDPRTQSLHRDLPESIPKANVIWPHEMKTISDWFAQACHESRLNCQAEVAFAIASTIRVRTNEIVKLRIKNVRLIGEAVEIEICTANTDGGMKSKNGRRTQCIECPVTSVLVRSWKQRRQEELALPDDYLFGDPQHPGRLHCPGQMQSLLNRVLKDATGDRSVSIHSLSHSWATNRFMDVSLNPSGIDVNAFDSLSVEAGHGDATMTFKNYVHRFEDAMRKEIDTAIAARIRWPEIKPFVSLSHASYRQRISRQIRGEVKVGEGQFKLGLIRACLPTIDLPSAHSETDVEDAVSTALSSHRIAMSLALVIDVLTDIESGIGTATVALRSCRRTEEITHIAAHARNLLEKLGNRYSRLTTRCFDTVDELRIALDHAHGKIDFAKIRQKKLRTLRELLGNRFDEPDFRDAIHSWFECYEHGCVSLAHPSRSAALLRLLKTAGIPISSIGIFHNPIANRQSVRLLQEVEAVFMQEFGLFPGTKECAVRGARPPVYLVITGVDFSERASSATLCMKGFNALLFAACVLGKVEKFNPLAN